MMRRNSISMSGQGSRLLSDAEVGPLNRRYR